MGNKQYLPSKVEILEYLQHLKNELNSDGIYKIGLFGSYAKDKADIASDIDINIETSQEFSDKYSGFNGFIYLDNLRKKIKNRFRIQVDLCDSASLTEEKKSVLLKGVIYV